MAPSESPTKRTRGRPPRQPTEEPQAPSSRRTRNNSSTEAQAGGGPNIGRPGNRISPTKAMATAQTARRTSPRKNSVSSDKQSSVAETYKTPENPKAPQPKAQKPKPDRKRNASPSKKDQESQVVQADEDEPERKVYRPHPAFKAMKQGKKLNLDDFWSVLDFATVALDAATEHYESPQRHDPPSPRLERDVADATMVDDELDRYVDDIAAAEDREDFESLLKDFTMRLNTVRALRRELAAEARDTLKDWEQPAHCYWKGCTDDQEKDLAVLKYHLLAKAKELQAPSGLYTCQWEETGDCGFVSITPLTMMNHVWLDHVNVGNAQYYGDVDRVWSKDGPPLKELAEEWKEYDVPAHMQVGDSRTSPLSGEIWQADMPPFYLQGDTVFSDYVASEQLELDLFNGQLELRGEPTFTDAQWEEGRRRAAAKRAQEAKKDLGRPRSRSGVVAAGAHNLVRKVSTWVGYPPPPDSPPKEPETDPMKLVWQRHREAWKLPHAEQKVRDYVKVLFKEQERAAENQKRKSSLSQKRKEVAGYRSAAKRPRMA